MERLVISALAVVAGCLVGAGISWFVQNWVCKDPDLRKKPRKSLALNFLLPIGTGALFSNVYNVFFCTEHATLSEGLVDLATRVSAAWIGILIGGIIIPSLFSLLKRKKGWGNPRDPSPDIH